MKKLYLYSSGGCGTRMFHKWAVKYFNLVNSQTTLHHALKPNRNKNKTVYLCGDPKDIILSFYKKNKLLGNFIRRHCGNLKIPPVTLSLKQYIESQKDLFKIEEHFDKYYNLKDIIIIKYDDIWNNQQTIGEYLEISMKDFPIRKKRSSVDGVDITEKDIILLKDTYKSLYEKLNKIKGVKIK